LTWTLSLLERLPGPIPTTCGSRPEDATSFVRFRSSSTTPDLGALSSNVALASTSSISCSSIRGQPARRRLDRQAAIEASKRTPRQDALRPKVREAHTEAERSWLKTVLDRMPAGVIIGEALAESCSATGSGAGLATPDSAGPGPNTGSTRVSPGGWPDTIEPRGHGAGDVPSVRRVASEEESTISAVDERAAAMLV